MSGPANDVTPIRPPRIMLVAVEPSGDALGASFLRELRTIAPKGLIATGCGGPLMAAEGFESLFPIDNLSVMGVIDVARALPEGLQRARELSDYAAAENVDAVIFIDGWAFSRITAQRMKKRGVRARLFKLAAPQVWASRPQRVNFVKAHFDGVLCLLPFEPPYFEKVGVKAEFIGNPNFQAAWAARGDGAAFRERHELGDAPLLAVLPGSRRGEVRQLLEPFEGAVRLLAGRIPELRVVTVLPPQVERLAQTIMEWWPGRPIFAAPEEKADAFAAADAALAKSGTVTTELAINRTPMVVAYKFDALTAMWARRVTTTPFVTILNIAAGREIVPELLQEACRPEFLAGGLLPLLTEEGARLEQLEEFPRLLAYLGVDGAPSAKRGAEKIAEWMGWR